MIHTNPAPEPASTLRPLPGPEIFEGIEELNLPDDPQGWHSNHPIFKFLIEEQEPETIIEVGSWKGASAIHMARTTEDHAEILVQNCKIFCVDTWLGGIDHELNQDEPTSVLLRDHGYPRLYFQFLHNVKKSGVHERVCPIPQTSLNGARFLFAHGITAPLVYIDASHEYSDVYADLCAYWPLVEEGGVMFGDDFNFEEIQAAVIRFVAEYKLYGRVQVVDKNFWVIRKWDGPDMMSERRASP